MSGTTETRRSLLDALLKRNKKEPSKVSEAMAMLQDALDKDGVERKELNEDKTKGLLEKLVADMAKVVGKLSDDAELVGSISNELAALAVGGLLQATEGTPVEDEVEDIVEGDTETETMQEDEEEELPEQLMELSTQVKALADESNENMKAMNDLIPAMVKMADTIAELKPLAKEVGKIEDLLARMSDIEKKQNMKPRAASSAKDTIVNNDELKAEIKKGAEGQKTVLGMPVNGKV